jgi:hypothetical protein
MPSWPSHVITHLLTLIALTISALTLGVVAGFAVSLAVFFLPVLLGQPEESMAGWGWVTGIPAIILGPAAGIASVVYLFRGFGAWGLLASPGTPLTGPRRALVGAFIAIPLVLVRFPEIGPRASTRWMSQTATDTGDGWNRLH